MLSSHSGVSLVAKAYSRRFCLLGGSSARNYVSPSLRSDRYRGFRALKTPCTEILGTQAMYLPVSQLVFVFVG